MAYLGAALILLGAAILVWRLRQAQGRREAFIQAFRYTEMLDRRLAARHPGWTLGQRRQVFQGLRDYFLICLDARRRFVSMPSQAVDDAWHEFILFSRQYQAFCRGAFGRFLHHTPAEAMRAPTLAQEGIKRAWRLACRREGIDPRQPDRLPLLFALDALLEHPHGFRYEADCMAGQATGPGGYCASHIGCGGGCAGDSGDADGGDSGGGDGGGSCGGD
jgi:hypothetical protein